MFLKVKLEGSGTPNDHFHVNLPTYSHVHGNITHGYALVLVPDEVHGLTDDDLADEEFEETTEGRLYHKLSDATLKKLHDNIDKRYQERAGQFRVGRA